ncbi:hypothetical protein PBC5_035 [Bacillus phage PBC5]|nr:hypothetical protein PBC5_035 [Bacillus phage PBC5]
MASDKKYCEVYKKIHPHVIDEVRLMVQGGFWKREVTNADKTILMGLFVRRVSQLYGFPTPKLYFDTGKQSKENYRLYGGMYLDEPNEIHIFYKPSLMTFLHEFRHAMQYRIEGLKLYRDDLEHDARAWSHSLYRLALPKSYKSAIEKGLFLHI